jgi:hypothetical protein
MEGMPMKKMISELVLGDAIKTRLVRMVGTPRGSYWVSVKKVAHPNEGEPNWRLVYNAGEVPAGFDAAWSSIRAEYQDGYQVE